MAHTVAAKIAAHQGYLDKLKAGASGTAAYKLWQDTTLLATLPIDHAASSVSGTTGQVTFVPGAAAVGVAAGTANKATLVARDGTVMNDNFPLADGAAIVAGFLTLTSRTIVVGGAVSIVSATLG